jgi:seryl-tRNA synthetase
VSKTIGEKMKASKGSDKCEEEKEVAAKLNGQIAEGKVKLGELSKAFEKKFSQIGNILDIDAPIFKDEDNNVVVAKWGEVEERKIDGETPGHMHHHELLQIIGGYDPERGTRLVGHRGYFLKGPGVLLNQALINYGICFLAERGYTPIQPPYFIKQDIMELTCEIGDFEENLYKVTGDDEEDKYLIATSEQPISAMHMKEWLAEKDLPMKYGGISSCFRKEAGSHGRDVWGIFRVH